MMCKRTSSKKSDFQQPIDTGDTDREVQVFKNGENKDCIRYGEKWIIDKAIER